MNAAKNRHRKQKGLLFVLIRLLILIAVLDLILFVVYSLKNHQPQTEEKMGTEQSEAIEQLETLSVETEEYIPLVEHPEHYPEVLLELAAKNPEALQFVLDYPEKKDQPCAETIEELQAGKIPHLLQWDERWGYCSYGDHMIGISGCGPTCLSMVASGLTGDNTLTPAVVAEWAEENGHYVSGSGSSWSLMTDGAERFGLTAEELPLDEGRMNAALEAGRPIILSVRAGNFTTTGHFIVLYGVEDGKFQVYDPNSKSLSDQLWDYETLAPQIRNLWAFEVSGQ